jgi:acetyltransferase-like isoleucine patch superfamily enzyme
MANKDTLIHKLADVQSEKVGLGTRIWQFCVVLENAVIGKECNINANVFIENDVVIGDNCTLKSGVQIWDGIRLGNNVFVGPNVTFTNDARPRSKKYPSKFLETQVKNYVSIGANATILPGIILGEYALIGAGAVVTKDVPPRALVTGNPARIVGWVNPDGSKMKEVGPNKFQDGEGNFWTEYNLMIQRL